MVLILQTEEENNAFLAAIEAIMSKGEESNTPDELEFLGLVAPIVEAYEKQLYKIEKVCVECAKRNVEQETKVTLVEEKVNA